MPRTHHEQAHHRHAKSPKHPRRPSSPRITKAIVGCGPELTPLEREQAAKRLAEGSAP
jgi:hypothetical protein